MMQAIRSTRPGGSVGYAGVPHGVELQGEELFYSHVRLRDGPAPVRRYLPQLDVTHSTSRGRLSSDGRAPRDQTLLRP
jgi:threonine dehydrogenase-like Zn-dependent dehydrogenase